MAVHYIVNVTKLFLDFPKIKKLSELSEPAQKCVKDAISKQNFPLSVLIASKMAKFLLFQLRGKSRFPPKKF